MDVHQRIREARARLRLTEDQFARLVGVSRTAVQQWENGRTAPSRKRQPVVAKAVGLSVAELMGHAIEAPGGTLAPRPNGVPLLSRDRVNALADRLRAARVADPERWMPCPVDHGPRTFAMQVWGDSMTSIYARSYPAGSIIFVDPDRLHPVDGDPVLARQVGRGEVTFKIFKQDDGRQWLQPLNLMHLPLREPFKVLGTVLGKWEDGALFP